MLHKTMIAVAGVAMLAAAFDTPVIAQENAARKSGGKQEGASAGSKKYTNIVLKRGSSAATKPAQGRSQTGKQQRMLPAVQKGLRWP
jgi:hypothetical protein